MRSVLRSRFSRNNIERAQASSLFQRYRKRVGQRQHWPHAGSKEDPEKEQFGNKMLMLFRVQKVSAQITKTAVYDKR